MGVGAWGNGHCPCLTEIIIQQERLSAKNDKHGRATVILVRIIKEKLGFFDRKTGGTPLSWVVLEVLENGIGEGSERRHEN